MVYNTCKKSNIFYYNYISTLKENIRVKKISEKKKKIVKFFLRAIA